MHRGQQRFLQFHWPTILSVYSLSVSLDRGLFVQPPMDIHILDVAVWMANLLQPVREGEVALKADTIRQLNLTQDIKQPPS